MFQQPFNLVTDSAYVARVAERAEHSMLKEISNYKLFHMPSKLIWLISHRELPFHIMHVRLHTDIPGRIEEGNQKADLLAIAVNTTHMLPDIFNQAKLSHQFYHQNVPALVRMFKITNQQARAIVTTCPNCQSFALLSMATRTNPWGFDSLELWQNDVTNFTSFGQLKYINVSVDIFSGAIFASAQSGEKTKDVTKHFYLVFTTLGVPQTIKTDNGPAYISKPLCEIQQWGIHHNTAIPYNPTGQSIVERAHREIKRVLEQHQTNSITQSPIERLCKALYVINFMNNSSREPNPPIIRHFSNNTQAHLREKHPVLINDPETKHIQGPFPLITWRRGYACVSRGTRPKWIPGKNIKPYLEPDSKLNPLQAHHTSFQEVQAQEEAVSWRQWKKKDRYPNIVAHVLITCRYFY